MNQLSTILLLLFSWCWSLPLSGQPSPVTPIQYAEGFEITYGEGYKLITVKRPWQGSKEPVKYLLRRKGFEQTMAADVVIDIPIQSIICTSTSHLPLIEAIGESNRLIGFPGTFYISSEPLLRRVTAGEIIDVGSQGSLNIEQILALEPSMVMAFSMGAEQKDLEKLRTLDVPVVLNGDYLETSALGRAEWIKFMAAFLDKEEMADSTFQVIDDNYKNLVRKTSTVEERPTVLSGVLYGDLWFMPGGQNNAAQFIEDAGARYLWRNNTESGWLELSFESVMDQALESDYWINVSDYLTLQQMEAADARYADFAPFASKRVYSYIAKRNDKGGNAFFELGYLRPDLVLADLIKIFHPQLLPEHSLYFYKRLP